MHQESEEQTANRWDESVLVGTVLRSVWQWQLVVAFCTVTVAVAISTLDASLFGNIWFVTGLVLVSAVTVAALVVHWTRGSRFVIMLPMLDVVAIGCLANAHYLLGYLWIMPIAWIATYYSTTAIVIALALVVASRAFGWLLPGPTTTTPLEVVIVLLALGFLGVATSQGARRSRAYRYLVRRQSRQLDRALTRATLQEQRAVNLFNSFETALVIVSPDGHIERSNSAYRSLYGYSGDDDRHPARAVEYSDYRGTALPIDQTTTARAARGERVRAEPLWLYDAEGRWRALSMSIRPRMILTPEDTPASIIEFDDVTVTELGRRAQRAAASAVSHELRNPLTAIMGHSGLLLEADNLTPAQREHAQVIDSAAERMLTLTANLLESNRPAEPDDALDLAALTGAAIAAFAPAAAASDLELTFDADQPMIINADGFRLRQAVDNLLSNAIKYTLRGGSVHVTLRRDHGDAVLAVRDTGIGISPDDLPHVFRPYFRAGTATTGGFAGTGLGMSIVRTIVEENQGAIGIESTLGFGTTTTITLPLVGPVQGGTP